MAMPIVSDILNYNNIHCLCKIKSFKIKLCIGSVML